MIVLKIEQWDPQLISFNQLITVSSLSQPVYCFYFISWNGRSTIVNTGIFYLNRPM